ncbi:hypothetical protein IGI04_023571 [Brassica rapa subsp. trilocularis]|uniref:Uncharacterized protein n=1 Tax=Brassica rapa subsp. trilocularis TaxID=1813537 RepID=A0ABQ7M4B1_BRACM|nr:hypothetical protein IGI04_023571 [Brassica rapa subsp. trilocularis]
MEEPNLLMRMFAAGDEALGERPINDALEPEELDFFRKSSFAKTIVLDENLPFSCAFGQFVSILDDPTKNWADGTDFGWEDETKDASVDNMVCLIGEGFKLRKEMFRGGVTATDLVRMRLEKHRRKMKLKKSTIKKQLLVKFFRDLNLQS